MGEIVAWNNEVKLVVSDVDETIADLYVDASSEMISKLEKILDGGRVLFLISGQSVESIQRRIVNHIREDLRPKVLIGHCSGVEVWGFDQSGNLKDKPFYSLYEEKLTDDQKQKWRDVIKQITSEFNLKIYPTMPLPEFSEKTKGDPYSIMLEDRRPQITFEVVNGYEIPPDKAKEYGLNSAEGKYDMRLPIIKRANELFLEQALPIDSRMAGVFAIDFVVKGVSKSTAVRYVMENPSIIETLGLPLDILNHPEYIEVWGDKFSVLKGGTDRHISEALPKRVRSITFRQENPEEFIPGYNTVVWNGKEHLHNGLLEYLKFRYN